MKFKKIMFSLLMIFLFVNSVNAFDDLLQFTTPDTSSSTADKYGYVFKINNNNIGSLEFVKDSSDTSTRCQLYNEDATVLLLSSTFSGDSCFLNYSYIDQVSYRLVADRNGNTRSLYYSNTAPSFGSFSQPNNYVQLVNRTRYNVGTATWSTDLTNSVYDELRIYTGQPTQIQFTNITLDSQVLINNTLISNITPILYTEVTNTSTNGNINITYNLDFYNTTSLSWVLLNNTQFVTNNLNGTTTLNEAVYDGDYRIYLNATNNETSTQTQYYYFGIDTQPSNVSVNDFTEWNNGYNVTNLNTTLNITCEDPNLLSCNIYWDDNTTTNILTTQYKVFSTNGNHTFNLTVVDLANNTATANGTIFINPYQNFYAQNSLSSTLLEDFKTYLDGTVLESVNNTVSFKLYDIGFGTYNLTYEKYGYNNATTAITLDNTSNYNLTTNMTSVTLSIKMYDITTSVQIPFNVTISNSTSSVTYNNQLNLQQNFTDLPSGSITVLVSSAGYSNARFYNTLTPYTSISINGYLSTSTEVVLFTTRDSVNDKPLGGVLIEVQQLINGSLVTLVQAQTSDDGQAFVYLNSSKEYQFIFTKSGYDQTTVNSIPGVTDYTVRLDETGIAFDFFTDVNTIFYPSGSVLYTNQSYNLSAFITGSSFTQIVYTVYDNNDNVLYTLTSTNPTGTTFTYEFTPNSTITSVRQEVTYYRDGSSNTEQANYKVLTLSDSFIEWMKNDFVKDKTEDSNIIRWLVMILTIGSTYLIAQTVIAAGGLVSAIAVGFFVWINWIPTPIGAVLVFGALVLWLGGRK